MTPDTSPTPDERRTAAVLRHDLVAPLTRILGYSELLIEDATAEGRLARADDLRAIRSLGKQVLDAIDRMLIWPPGRPADIAALLPDVLGPSGAIIEACDSLEEATARAPEDEGFLEDLAQVRQDSALLIGMVRQASEAPAAAD